jgi:tRNA A37 threonylcarbamoyladenosine dehydratase
MAVPYWLSRMSLMLPEEQVEKLMNANVLVIGLGGVGGICAEMIARAGVGKMTIVDGDTVDASNINRQIPALTSTVGQNKVEVMAARIKDINPDIQLRVLNEFVKDHRTDEILDEVKFDYAVDCIDTLSPKVFFIKACLDRKIPIVSSMGAGGKVDPSKIKVVDISKTYQCNLAKYVRKRLYHLGTRKGVKVVFSPEAADQTKIVESPKAFPKKSLIGTVSYMPAMFGCTLASVVIRDLIDS